MKKHLSTYAQVEVNEREASDRCGAKTEPECTKARSKKRKLHLKNEAQAHTITPKIIKNTNQAKLKATSRWKMTTAYYSNEKRLGNKKIRILNQSRSWMKMMK